MIAVAKILDFVAAFLKYMFFLVSFVLLLQKTTRIGEIATARNRFARSFTAMSVGK